MPSLKYVIKLSDQNKAELIGIVTKGKSPDRTILRANILLVSDQRSENDQRSEKYMTVSEISKAYHTTPTTVQNVRTSYCERGLKATINRKKRETPPIPAKVTGEVEEYVIALACSESPEGYPKWTLRLLANKTVELGYIDSISHITVSTVLKNEFKPNLKKCWCFLRNITQPLWQQWKMCLRYIAVLMTNRIRLSVWMKSQDRFSKRFRSKKDGIQYEDYQYIRNG